MKRGLEHEWSQLSKRFYVWNVTGQSQGAKYGTRSNFSFIKRYISTVSWHGLDGSAS